MSVLSLPARRTPPSGKWFSAWTRAADGEGRLLDLEHAVLIEQLVVEAVLLELVQGTHDGIGQSLVGEGKAGNLRKDAADRAREVAALLHVHRRRVNRGGGVRLAGTQRLEGLAEIVEGHDGDRLQALLGDDVGNLAGAL